MSISAIVLSKQPYSRRFDGLDVVPFISTIADAEEATCARFRSIEQVRTPFFFFLDDDDDLPPDYKAVLDECMKAGAAMVYTEEAIRDGHGEQVSVRGPYSQAAHLRNVLLVHHLVLCRTREAQETVQRLPRGHYYPEMLLYWELAKLGVSYLAAVGYIWNKRSTGMHNWPSTTIAQVRTALWCREHP